MFLVPSNLFADAVRTFWEIRNRQSNAQTVRGSTDQGARGAVTGGAQMGGFISTIRTLLVNAGVRPDCIFAERRSLQPEVSAGRMVSLPGYYRATKDWDLLVVIDGNLVAALEVKSQVGPSFGNNFNNRSEEAIGTAADIWTAFREGALGSSSAPWLGYLFLLEDCDASRRPVSTIAPHFAVLPEFVGASYARRYELLCRKLVRERQYSAACFLMAAPTQVESPVNYSEPADDLSGEHFLALLLAHVSAYT